MKFTKLVLIAALTVMSYQAKAAVVVAGMVATMALSMPVASTAATMGGLNSEDVQFVKNDAILAQAGYEVSPALSSVLQDSRYLIEAQKPEFFAGKSEIQIEEYLINVITNL